MSTIKKYIPKEDIKFIETQMEQEVIEQHELKIIKEEHPQEQLIIDKTQTPMFVNSYERYEWLLQNGCKAQEDRLWLEQYIKSDEYKEIYE